LSAWPFALEQAKRKCRRQGRCISGCAENARQFVAADLTDEITFHLAPVLLGSSVRLLDHLGAEALRLERVAVTRSALVTHLR